MVKILFPAFWNSFEKGVYPEKIEIISDNIEKYSDFLQGIGYTYSIIKLEYITDIFAIKGIFFIAIYSMKLNKLIGTINYNPYKKRNDFQFYKNEFNDDRLKSVQICIEQIIVLSESKKL